MNIKQHQFMHPTASSPSRNINNIRPSLPLYQIPPCPTCSFPGIWSQNILELEDSWYGSVEGNDTIGSPCSMLDSCE